MRTATTGPTASPWLCGRAPERQRAQGRVLRGPGARREGRRFSSVLRLTALTTLAELVAIGRVDGGGRRGGVDHLAPGGSPGP